MSIDRFYTKTVSVKGLTQVGATDKEIFTTKIAVLDCRIEAQSEEPVMLEEGAFYTLFKMWCDDADIIVGDQVIEGSTVYIVKGVSELKGATEDVHHLEILLAIPR